MHVQESQEYLECRIAIGLIVSTEYLQRMELIWDSVLLDSPEIRHVASWVWEYFRQYRRAPGADIEAIFHDKKPTLPKAEAEYIEQLLSRLSDEFEREGQFNAGYLYDKTIAYFKAQELKRHSEEVQALIDSGRVEEAERLAASFVSRIVEYGELGLDLASEEALNRVERAFTTEVVPVITYPGALGELWNEQLVRGAFFSLLAPEKRGKTWWLIELAMRAVRQKANVAFFAAGDMTESQMLRRICVYIARRSDRPKYCQERFVPVGDCVLNQLDLCERKDRNCNFGIFDLPLEEFQRSRNKLLTKEVLRERFESNPDYCACDSHACRYRQGSVWLKKVPAVRPLTAEDAKRALQSFFQRYRRRFKLVCVPAGTLTIQDIRSYLDNWERRELFVPDVIVVDYADLLSARDSCIAEYRHQQDHVWKSLRALSQEMHALVITATQADAASYQGNRLTMSNFSEDKRKLAHVTAQYGLNQDSSGREKELGIMRINEIVVREGEFLPTREVYVLMDLAGGRPYLESFGLLPTLDTDIFV